MGRMIITHGRRTYEAQTTAKRQKWPSKQRTGKEKNDVFIGFGVLVAAWAHKGGTHDFKGDPDLGNIVDQRV
jgi:phosphoglycerate dehydrogenase-like enzyme